LRNVLVFCWGWIAGMLFLLVLLWSHGSLHPVRTVRAAAQRERTEADRVAPVGNDAGVPDLIIPVQGASPGQIRDTFADGRGKRRHEATDIMAPRGTPVLAVDNGLVAKLFLSRAGGITIYQFDATQRWCYYYAHLDRYAARLLEGAAVHTGEIIGYVGSTGNASAEAPHLHFAIFELGPEKHWWQGKPIDPYPILLRHARK
jgi:murein DD-endopeptidase MepM/ murein hydrolase activator NlpD